MSESPPDEIWTIAGLAPPPPDGPLWLAFQAMPVDEGVGEPVARG